MAISIVHPTQRIQGTIHLTASKSESNRALLIRALCGVDFEIRNLSDSDDTVSMNQLLSTDEKELNVGLAGTVMRFLTAYLAVQPKEVVLTGAHRMKERPIAILVKALQDLGASIEYLEKPGYPPLKISGKRLAGGKITIDGGVSSQYISALLMIAPNLENGLQVQFEGEVISRPYINMTIQIMKHFGASVSWEGDVIKIDAGAYQPKPFEVEADWSAASYWYSLVALAEEADITLYGLKEESLQGDAIVQDIYQKLGVNTELVPGGIRLTKRSGFKIQEATLTVDFINCPDIAQTVAVTCAALNVSARLTGLKTLRIKETDRVAAIRNELTQLGYQVEVEEDDVLILPSLKDEFTRSGDQVKHSSVQTYHDHRMAMAFASLALCQKITIEDEAVVSKSYPNFWDDLKKVGFMID